MKTKLILLFMLISFSLITAQDKGKYVELKKMPKIIKQAIPAYPELARKLGVTGKVVLQLNIDEKGNVTDTQVLTVNYEQADDTVLDDATKLKLKDIFEQPAVDAAKKMKFSPGIDKSGKAVKSTVVLPFKFALGDKDTHAKGKK